MKTIGLEELEPGKRILMRDTTVTIIEYVGTTEDRFGMRLYAYRAHRADTDQTGIVHFGLNAQLVPASEE